MGGRQQPASGATPWAKEDIITPKFLVQHKEVQPGTKSHTIKWDEIKQLRRNAIDADRLPVYVIDVLDHKRRYFLVPDHLFQIIEEELGEPV